MMVVRGLASMRLTLVGMIVLAVMSIAASEAEFSRAWLALPLGLLAANLLAALIARPVFHRVSGLLVFHLGLLGLLALAALSSLIVLEGQVEITEGQSLSEAGIDITGQGPLHRLRLDAIDFTQGAVTVNYAPGLVRQDTRSEIYIGDSDTPTVLSDARGFAAEHYRFTTTSNKGFAALVSWQDSTGVVRGAIHFPSYPAYEWKQTKIWTTPDDTRAELELKVAKPPRERAWSLRSSADKVSLMVRRDGEQDTPLTPGQSLRLGSGVLRFEEVRLWIGYEIDFNPLSGWMFGMGCLAIVGIACHFRRRAFPARSESGADGDIVASGIQHVGAG